MGRPKKELNELKVIRVNVRMTIDDYNIASNNAGTIGLSIAEYIRRKVTKKSLPRKKISVADRKIFVELSRIGNNLNQLTKIAHAGIRDPLSIHQQLVEVQELLYYLKAKIAH